MITLKISCSAICVRRYVNVRLNRHGGVTACVYLKQNATIDVCAQISTDPGGGADKPMSKHLASC